MRLMFASLGVFVVGLGCGPGAPAEAGATTEVATSGAGSVTTAMATTATSGSGGLPTTSGAATSTGVTGSSGDETCGGAGRETEGERGCDVVAQDCGCGHKCAPVGLELGCVPLADDAVAVGDECVVDLQGRDRCARGSFCPTEWFATPSARCVALCDSEGAGCPADTLCMRLGVEFGLCLRACDPLAPACGADEECASPFPMFVPDSPFACLPAGGDGGLCDGCSGPTSCASGFACRQSFSCGIDGGAGACTPYCDLDLPACPAMLACVPWYVDPPPGLEHVGTCA